MTCQYTDIYSLLNIHNYTITECRKLWEQASNELRESEVKLKVLLRLEERTLSGTPTYTNNTDNNNINDDNQISGLSGRGVDVNGTSQYTDTSSIADSNSMTGTLHVNT
jgi:hypothetical protein